jgi:hypothetical protein
MKRKHSSQNARIALDRDREARRRIKRRKVGKRKQRLEMSSNERA